jgi:hypothetical protein
MPLKKSVRVKKSTRWNKSPRMKKLTSLTGETGTWATALVVMCVMAAALLFAAHQAPDPADSASSDVELQPAEPRVVANRATPAVTPVAVNASVVDSPAKPLEPKSPVTITGCLERVNKTFRLKDTSGVDVPKARSWKSGFLKKGPASVEIVDAGNRLKLRDHVGQRVSVTGTLVDREIRGRSLQRVAASCGESSRAKT